METVNSKNFVEKRVNFAQCFIADRLNSGQQSMAQRQIRIKATLAEAAPGNPGQSDACRGGARQSGAER